MCAGGHDGAADGGECVHVVRPVSVGGVSRGALVQGSRGDLPSARWLKLPVGNRHAGGLGSTGVGLARG